MNCGNGGCCCGIIVGFVLAILLLCAAGFGVYCWFVPEARNNSLTKVETTWSHVKEGGDAMIEKARASSNSGKASEPLVEPEVTAGAAR